MNRLIPVAELCELSEEQGKPIRINNKLIALFKLESGEVYAIENACPHVGAPLDNGLIEGKELTCLWHGWIFSLETGLSSNCPGVKVTTYPVKIQGEQVFLEIEEN